MNTFRMQPYSRRDFLGVSLGAGLASASGLLAAENDLPQSVKELWADFDPRTDPLEIETVR